MDAQEGLAVQRLFQLAEHRVHEMGVAVHVNAHIIAFGLQPPDVGEREAALVASDLNPEVGLRHGERAAFELGEARLEKGEPLSRAPSVEIASSLFDRLGEPIGSDRLDHEIGRSKLERLDRMVLEGGHEDDRRRRAWPKRLEHGEAVHDRHLDVEQKDVRAEPLDELQGFAAAIGFADDFDIGKPLQHLHQPSPSERLVIHNQHTHQRLPAFTLLTFIDQCLTPVECTWLCRPGPNSYPRLSSYGGPLDSTQLHAGSAAPARLRRGAGLLIAVFWSAHFLIMWMRAQIDGITRERDVIEGTLYRVAFALFGAFLSYLLYRCLRPLRLRGFARQAMIGAALALAAALIQGAVNTFVFGDTHRILATFMFYALYWFWFYFSWTTAYLALSYSLTVQEQERHAAELAVMAQEAQVRALRYQINPHFLFNTLNAIAALIRDAPGKAEEMVVQLSDFFRRSLAVNPMEDLTLAEEVELQRLYLEIERTRFPERLRLDVVLEDDVAEARVPALLLQPLVENAVKHGVARSEGSTCIRIRARRDGPDLEIVVENDAAAQGPRSAGEKVGLRNVAERLQSRFGDQASLESGAIEEGGFRNTIRLPIRR